jgi:hypothetical protein
VNSPNPSVETITSGPVHTIRTRARQRSPYPCRPPAERSAWSLSDQPDPREAGRVLPATLAGGLESVVAEPRDPRLRSAAISSIVDEIYQSVTWALGGDVGQPELVSLARVLAAAHAHEARIAALVVGDLQVCVDEAQQSGRQC